MEVIHILGILQDLQQLLHLQILTNVTYTYVHTIVPILLVLTSAHVQMDGTCHVIKGLVLILTNVLITMAAATIIVPILLALITAHVVKDLNLAVTRKLVLTIIKTYAKVL
jgi:hypothetical protein